MPVTSGVSNGSVQTLLDGHAINPQTFELRFPEANVDIYPRVGFFKIIILLPDNPDIQRVLSTGYIYTPGILHEFSGTFQYLNPDYRIVANWDNAGLAWELEYNS